MLGYSLPLNDQEFRLYQSCGISSKISSEFGDVVDAAKLIRVTAKFQPTVILHLAAQALVRKSYVDPLRTYAVNVMGTANVLEAARQTDSVSSVVIITTDKCYENQEWIWPYRENDRLGGHDPYSSSKACAELVASCFRSSFFRESGKLIATARAGNVIGGGDCAEDRLIPDAVRAFVKGEELEIRSPGATRPWQHVLDPLHGYLLLAQRLMTGDAVFADAFNFGPLGEHSVGRVVEHLVRGWGGGAGFRSPPGDHPHEAGRLHLDSSKARQLLNWQPKLELESALDWTLKFYRAWENGADPDELIREDLDCFERLVPSGPH